MIEYALGLVDNTSRCSKKLEQWIHPKRSSKSYEETENGPDDDGGRDGAFSRGDGCGTVVAGDDDDAHPISDAGESDNQFKRWLRSPRQPPAHPARNLPTIIISAVL